jgi:Fructose-2,6-bisphosphatase
MTEVYFIRHAQSDRSVRDGRARPLTEKGLADRRLVTEFLQDKKIDVVLSSPFRRAIDTVADFAEKNGLKIEMIEDFRERKSDSDCLRDTDIFQKRQWDDFSYTLSDGECLAEVQRRNIAALSEVLERYEGKNIAIGTHGMALSTIINYYDGTYGLADWTAMKDILPWVVKMSFAENRCMKIEKINLFA